MGTDLFSLPPELWRYTGQKIPLLADYISWWWSSVEVRRRLNVGLGEVKVGRLLLPFCFLFVRTNV